MPLSSILHSVIKSQMLTENIGINVLEPNVFNVTCEAWCCGLVLLLWNILARGYGWDIDICRFICTSVSLYSEITEVQYNAHFLTTILTRIYIKQ